MCSAQTYDADVRDVYAMTDAAADKWLSKKREEEEKQKEARVLERGRTSVTVCYITYSMHEFAYNNNAYYCICIFTLCIYVLICFLIREITEQIKQLGVRWSGLQLF